MLAKVENNVVQESLCREGGVVSMNGDALDGPVLQEVVEESHLSMKLAKNENGSVNGWERQWRDRMPSSTRMWRAVSEQKK